MKKLYDILNDVQIDLEEYKEQSLTDIEKAQLKKNMRKKMGYSSGVKNKKHIVAASLLAGIVCMGCGGSVLASGTIMGYDLEYLLGIDRGSLADYKTVVDQVVVDNGVGIRLNEVVLDGQALVINTTFEFDEPIEGQIVHASREVYINGKEVNRGGTGGGKKEDENTYVTASNVYLHDTEIPEGDMDIKIVYKSIHMGDKTIKGKWVFEFKTNRESLLAEAKVMKVDKKIIINEEQIVYIDNVQVTPLATTIEFWLNDRIYDIGFNIEDQDGNEIQEDSMSLSRGEGFSGVYRFNTINETVTKLKVTPWYKLVSEGSGKDSNDYTYMEEESFEVEVK